MDRDALVTLCGKRFRDTSNVIVGASTSTPVSWIEYLDAAYKEVNRATPLWPWLEATDSAVTVTGGSRSGNLPSDVFQVHSVYNVTNQWTMKSTQGRNQVWEHYDTLNDTGLPETYRIRNNTLHVYPIPQTDTCFNVEAVLLPTSLSSGASEPVFPEGFHDILVEGALALAYQDDGAPEQHDRHWQKFKQQIEDMKWFILAFRTESYSPVRDTFYEV